MLAIDSSGNKLLDFINVNEEDAAKQFTPITVCLLVVKIGNDYLMGFTSLKASTKNLPAFSPMIETHKIIIAYLYNQ